MATIGPLDYQAAVLCNTLQREVKNPLHGTFKVAKAKEKEQKEEKSENQALSLPINDGSMIGKCSG